MYDFDVNFVLEALDSAVKLCGAVSKLVSDGGEFGVKAGVLKKTFSDARKEVARIKKMMKEDGSRPLLER